ncbi:hypothetical protein TeGR_g2832 [Tetraparma gracilis]|uniref:Uncharacterized protein n=1 Tax=Tetraparma gracilis TaxID=2962635 RepID=A0ABQ6MJE3_9STRA|nr:hypothetical protein TeGR_g2832 [Tetraparma gracilis]
MFDSVVYWRQLVTKLLDVEFGTRDPLEKLNKVPWLKPLVQGWRENFAIEHAGRYSIVLIVGIELVEFMTQTTNASRLARYLDWDTLGFYVNIIAANSVLFGVCLVVPERFVDESGMVAVDVLIDATYIMFNILYFKNGVTAATVCGFGVDLDPRIDAWELDVSGCELEELGGWKEAYADLEVLNAGDNELAELPGWLGEERMGKLRELRASNNTLWEFGFADWRESVGGVNSTALEVVDLRDNEIVELVWEMMAVEGEGLQLLFDGNPCAEEVDWVGLGQDRLPARMGAGYDNGNFSSSLRVLKMAHNELDQSVFEELAAANFVNITDLDVSWNALGGIGEEVREQKKLRRLDVSGNSGVGAR